MKGCIATVLLAGLQKKISTMCLADLLESCKNTHTNEAVAEMQKGFVSHL